MTAKPRSIVDWEGRWLQWGCVGLESAVLYLILAALTSGRDEASPPLLAVLVALTLPIAALLRWLFDETRATGPTRTCAVLLASLAWTAAVARWCAPPGYWQSDAPRELLILGALFSGHGAGQQPIAFWTALLAWWRGQMLPAWEPTPDESMGRFRLGCVAVAVAVGIVSPPGGVPRERLLEQLVAMTLFLASALLCTSLSRRRELAGGLPLASSGSVVEQGTRAIASIATIVAVAALLALSLAAWGADAASPALLQPVVDLAGSALHLVATTIVFGLAALINLWPFSLPEPSAPPVYTPITGQGVPWIDLSFLANLLGPLFLIITVMCFVLVAAIAILALRRGLFQRFDSEIHAVQGNAADARDDPDTSSRMQVLAAVMRILRGIRGRPRRRHRPPRDASRTVARAAASLPARTVRETYRAYLAWAATLGYGRHLAETPDELRSRLTTALPAVGREAWVITDSYVAVRYGGESESALQTSEADEAFSQLRNKADPEAIEPLDPDPRSRR